MPKYFEFWSERVPPLFYIAWLSYQIGCVHLNVFWTCVWRKKKTLAFEIRYFLCGGCKKKKYNSAIFPFINDRCCFIVVNIVFHAPWSITCLSHVLILYIVYIWFHLCKKKTQTFHCIYLKISSQNKFVLRHRATANNMCCFFIIWIIFSL